MRISCDTTSPDYHPAGMHGTLRFNGVVIKNCVWLDDATGTVILVNADGERETRRGIVRISFPAECANMAGYPAIPEKYIVRIKEAVPGLVRTR